MNVKIYLDHQQDFNWPCSNLIIINPGGGGVITLAVSTEEVEADTFHHKFDLMRCHHRRHHRRHHRCHHKKASAFNPVDIFYPKGQVDIF